MSEPIQSIANGTYMIGETSNLNFEAGPGIKITEPSEGTVRIANDETVLYSGDSPTTSATLSEPVTNFETFKIKVYSDECFEFSGKDENHTIQFGIGNSAYLYFKMVNFVTNGTSLTTNKNLILNYGQWDASSPGLYYNKTSELDWLREVVGINRISGGN